MKQNNNYMDKKGEVIFLIILIMIFMLVIVWFIVLGNSFGKFKKTEEGKCFIKVAREYCNEQDMDFKKIYVREYGDYEFACVKRGNVHGYDFNKKEKLKCGDYYGTR